MSGNPAAVIPYLAKIHEAERVHISSTSARTGGHATTA